MPMTRRTRATELRGRMRPGAVSVAMVVGLALVASACGGGGSQNQGRRQPPAEVKTSEPPRTVRFLSEGVRLEGALYGEGDVGVVLAGGKGGQSQWGEDFTQAIAGAGFVVLAYNWRGVCPKGPGDPNAGCSQGKPDITVAGSFGEACGLPPSKSTIPDDIRAAIAFLRSEGVDQVFLLGEGHIGGNGSIYVAAEDPDLAGLISLGGGGQCEAYGLEAVPIDVYERITVPVLFIEEAGFSTVGTQYAKGPTEQLLVPEFGFAALFGEDKELVVRTILDFLKEHANE